jgi:uncharacterized protein YfbU (UPF0304 family)
MKSRQQVREHEFVQRQRAMEDHLKVKEMELQRKINEINEEINCTNARKIEMFHCLKAINGQLKDKKVVKGNKIQPSEEVKKPRVNFLNPNLLIEESK